MAIQQRLYVLKGPSNAELQQFVDPSVSAVQRYRTAVIQVEYDDTNPLVVDTLDQYMDQQWGLDTGQPQKDPGFINELLTSYVSATTVQIGTGYCKANNDKDDLQLTAPVNVDITVSGVNGLDTGVESANNWYYIFVIGDTTGANPTAGILSAAANAPTFPPGYDTYRRVGSVRNQGGDFRPFEVVGDGNFRQVQYRDAITSRQRLTGGAATVVTAVSCSQVIPSTSTLGRFQIVQRGTVDGWIYDDTAQPLATYQRFVPAGLVICDEIRVMPSRDIGYANAAAGGLLDIYVTGYQESI